MATQQMQMVGSRLKRQVTLLDFERLSSGLAVTFALTSMSLWFIYKGHFPDFGPRMRFNCALMLFSIWLEYILVKNKWMKAAALVGVFVIICSLATLSQDLFGIDFGIDNFLIQDRTELGGHFVPGRMSPASALAFAAVGGGILNFARKGFRALLGEVALIFSTCTSMITLAGHSFGAKQLYTVTNHIKMSEYTALGVLFVCFAVFCSRPEMGLLRILLSRQPSGHFARRMLTASALFPPLLSFVMMVTESSGGLTHSASAALSAIATFLFFSSVIWMCAHSMQSAEKELMEEKLRAERASEAKTQFLANMSHEIRTPVGAILGFSAMLKDPSILSTARDQFAQIIERNSETLLRLIDDILDLSKVEADKVIVERQAVSPTDILSDLTLIMKLRADAKNIALRVFVDGQLPEKILCDGLRLRQILTNIIGNAIKFTSVGSVEVKLRHDNDRLFFEVSDTGPGIDPSNVAKLFKPFSQADASTTRQFGGSGLGLVLSRQLCRLLDGDLELGQSIVGIGSVFRGSVAAAPIAPLASVGETAATPHEETAAKLMRGKILVVDDSPDNRLLLTNYLRQWDGEILTASNGEEAIQQALENDPDLILMDIQMPLMDGHEATRTLRHRAFTKPIIALTAHAMKEERERADQSGCTDYLTKPINQITLLETIARHLSC